MSYYRRMFVPGGTFFFTVKAANPRSTILVDCIDRLRSIWAEVAREHPFQTVAVSILPNHLHTIWALPENDTDYSERWRLIKSGFSRGLPAAQDLSPSKIAKREKGIWQRRYWEHRIRDEKDLENHINYIHINPMKHGHVTRVVDWPYSSFHRYVACGWLPSDWGGDVREDGVFGE